LEKINEAFPKLSFWKSLKSSYFGFFLFFIPQYIIFKVFLRKKMHKNLVGALCAVLIGQSIYSCSELILPKRIDVEGTLSSAARIGSTKINSIIEEEVKGAFADGAEDGVKVYNIDYKGQTTQAFCISFPVELTEDLNPDDFLKTIDRQINDGINAAPKEINVSIPYFGVPIPVDEINLVDNIPSVSLADIARYVITIDFDKSNGNDDSAGIGINFYFSEIPDGLQMILKCAELDFSSDPKPLKKGDNIFGNNDKLTLVLEEYKGNNKQLDFIMILQSAGPTTNAWNPVGINYGEMIEIKGEMRFFRNWTKAEIDMGAAVRTTSDLNMEDLSGVYPRKAMDLSRLGKFLSGEFIFNGLEAKIYMDGPDPDSINAMHANLIMEAYFNNDKVNLYDDLLYISESMNMNDYLNDNDVYIKQHLPETTSEYADRIDKDAISKIFNAMPADLLFMYRIKLDGYLTVYPETFADDTGDSAEGSKVTSTMLIILPLDLTAMGDDDNKSAILLPDMFGNDDLFGRDAPEDLFGEADINNIRMTINFSDKIITNGYLFINEDKDLFLQGVKLNGKTTTASVPDAEIERIQEKLIIPDIKIEMNRGGTVNVPKKTVVVKIRFEMKGLIRPGEL